VETAATVEEFLVRCRAERAQAGFPRHVEDPVALDKLVTIVAGHDRDRGRRVATPAAA
jgi:hypothetical protein